MSSLQPFVLFLFSLVLAIASGYSPILPLLPCVPTKSVGSGEILGSSSHSLKPSVSPLQEGRSHSRQIPMVRHSRSEEDVWSEALLYADVPSVENLVQVGFRSTRASSGVALMASSWKERILGFMGAGGTMSDGLTLRERVAKTGVYVGMSYSVVSNLNMGITMSIASYLFSVRNGVSPLSPCQWRRFVSFYTGFWLLNNFLRPIRLGAALALAPRMSGLTQHVQDRFQLDKSKATVLTFVTTYLTAWSFSASLVIMSILLSGAPLLPNLP